MRKTAKRFAVMLMAIILCLSLLPLTAMAESGGTVPSETPAVSETTAPEPDSTAEPDTEPAPEQAPEPAPDDAQEPDAEPAPEDLLESTPEVTEEPGAEPTQEPAADSVQEPAAAAPDLSGVQPELAKTVAWPLVKVEYRYYDDAASTDITGFDRYSVVSAASYYALALATEGDAAITFAAHKFPGTIPVSTDALRFRVLMDGETDITALAAYHPDTGMIALPFVCMGHAITVEWYCPASEITELPVNVTTSVNTGGRLTKAVHDLSLSSETTTISVPLSATAAVVWQNGVELPSSAYSLSDGTLTIAVSPLGGDIYVSAYMPSRTRNASVTFTKSEDSIYYGYYTSYYTANGNTSFCLNPTVSSIPSGTYPISRYLQPGVDDLLIKCLYYLYGGPGYDSVKHNLFEDPDALINYGYSHAVASLAYSGNSSQAYHGLSSSVIDHLNRVLSSVSIQPMPPSGFEAYLINEADSATQTFSGWSYNPTGNVEIVKASNNPAMTDNNPCYSLSSAVFSVYDGNGSMVGTITTDSNGRGQLNDLPAGGGYYLVETKAPKGYALSGAKTYFTVVSGQTVSVGVTNIAQGDPVGILLMKRDAERGTNAPQGDGSMAGALFTIKFYKGLFSANELSGKTPARTWVVRTDSDGYAMLDPAYLVSGDALYYNSTGRIPTLPLGTVTIQETQAPTGYLLNNELYVRQITATGNAETVFTYNEPIVPDNPIRGGVSIEKWDFDLNRRAVPQGDATLAGAVFEIYNRSVHSVIVGGQTYAPGALVHTMITDQTGTATTTNDLLPYGTYEIVEKSPPVGYLGTGVLRQSFSIRSHGVIVSLKTAATVIKNNVIRGGVEIYKWDIERDEQGLVQGDATLQGAVLEIWNRSPRSVVVEGREYAPGQVVAVIETDKAGYASTPANLLPYGSYEIIEKTPPTGYLNTGIIKQSFQIRENGAIVSLTASDTVIKNDIIRGGVRVEKWDHEIDEHRAQGGTTFEGAIFEIVNRSRDAVLVQGVLYGVGEVVYTFTTDADGSALTPNDLLPYGTYEVREIAPPEGYLHTGVLSRTFVIRDHGKTVEMNTWDTAIKNDPIRGDLRGVKISDGDAKRLAYVSFTITSLTTGESHVIVTDRNGEFSTATSWNPHSQNTNRGETDRDGIWFGELSVLNDNVGALLYDTYLIEELPCESNEGYELLSFTVSIYRHNTVVDLGTLTDDHIPVPEIFTTAVDKETMANTAYASETTTILDTVYYSGLTPGRVYVISGILMDKATGKPLLINGEPVTSEKEFRATADAGSVSVEFTFDSTAIAGKSVVVFETLMYEDAEIAVHADIEDEGQTVEFAGPSIGTSAAGPDGEKALEIGAEITLVDTVSYDNLIAGVEYKLTGVLMDRDTGEALLIGGKPVTAETSFTAETANGTATVEFTFDSTGLIGKTIVVFETLNYNGREIAAHTDITDENQTVTFQTPKIGTTAKAEDGSKTVPLAEKVTVVDTVSYENLAPGKEYVLKGTLMDKESGLPLMSGGAPVTSEVKFTPTESSGTVEVRFTFDSRAIAGRTLVVFEALLYDGTEIATHADITDEGQSVIVNTPEPAPTPTPTPEPEQPVPGKPVPQTGDDYMIVAWLVLAAVSLPGLLVSAVLLRKKKRRITVVFILCAVLFAVSSFMAVSEYRQYADSADAYEKLEQYVTMQAVDGAETPEPDETETPQEAALSEEASEEPGASAPVSLLPTVDFNALREINPDIKGWLFSEGTTISYPIAQSGDNSYYLNHLYDGSRGKAGTPFLDYENSVDFTDRNSIVYGHNLLAGTMFSQLIRYKEQSYYDAHPTLLLLTPDGSYTVEIFAAFTASPNESGADTSPWRQAWGTDGDFTAWLSHSAGRSVIETGVEPEDGDRILTLSTCTNSGRDRFLVMGRLVPAE